jgi:hypothetical protein
MSIRVMTAVWDRSKHTKTALLILLALADFANDEGFCWPSIDTLAHKARCSRRHVQRLLQEMGIGEDREVEIRENAGPNGVHLYRITIPVAPRRTADATAAARGDILSPGVTPEAARGDILPRGGDISSPQMSPEPSLTINGIKREPSEDQTTAAADSPAPRSKADRLAGDHQVLAIMTELGIADGQARRLSLHFTVSEAEALADVARRMEPDDLGAYAAQLFRDHLVEAT